MPEHHSAFGFLDWTVLVGYLLLTVGLGLYAGRGQKDADSYFLGGRRMPLWAVALSVLATSLSAATYIGAPQQSFSGDLTYLIMNLGGVTAAFVVAFLFIPPLYRSGTITIYGYLGKRFGEPSVVAASAMFLLGRLLSSGARLFMAGIAFALMLYGDTQTRDLILAILIFGVVGTIYTATGGIKAVIWTDTVQIITVVAAALLSIYLLARAIPLTPTEMIAAWREFPTVDAATGAETTVNKLRILDLRLDPALSFTLWTGLIAATFSNTASYGVDQDMLQRTMTARSSLRASWSMVASILLGVPVVFLFLVIGLLLAIFYGRPDLMGDAAPLDPIVDTNRVYPQFLLNHLPAGVRGVAMAGLFAAALSTFDSAINAMASAAVADLYWPWRERRARAQGRPSSRTGQSDLHTSRVLVVLMGLLLTLFAILAVFLHQRGSNSLIDFALGVMAFALAPLLGVFSAALFTRRGNNTSVITGVVVGFFAVLLLQPDFLPRWTGLALAWPWHYVITSPIVFAVCVLGRPAAKEKPPREAGAESA